jgi:hypothetical protein
MACNTSSWIGAAALVPVVLVGGGGGVLDSGASCNDLPRKQLDWHCALPR